MLPFREVCGLGLAREQQRPCSLVHMLVFPYHSVAELRLLKS